MVDPGAFFFFSPWLSFRMDALSPCNPTKSDLSFCFFHPIVNNRRPGHTVFGEKGLNGEGSFLQVPMHRVVG